MTTLTGTIEAKGIAVRAKLSNKGADYISLTDIAKYRSEDANQTICNWMRLRNTIDYLGLWEQLNNPDFKPLEFEGFRKESGANAFLMSPKKWITSVNAIGITSKSGRYGGTYAHSDIAFKFAAWLSPEFELYLIKDYQRLKQDESNRLSLDWSARREIAKTNYRIHTDAVKKFLIDEALPANLANRAYASEADIINMALFGMTAKEWREKHPEAKGNVRDNAAVPQLIVIANLEAMNAEYIKQGLPQSQRLQLLRIAAASQLRSILSTASVKRLEKKTPE
jgi:hypothetical protein